jgi:hypothetical protein
VFISHHLGLKLVPDSIFSSPVLKLRDLDSDSLSRLIFLCGGDDGAAKSGGADVRDERSSLIHMAANGERGGKEGVLGRKAVQIYCSIDVNSLMSLCIAQISMERWITPKRTF